MTYEDLRSQRAGFERSITRRSDAPAIGHWMWTAWRHSRAHNGCPPPALQGLYNPSRVSAVWLITKEMGCDQMREERMIWSTMPATLRVLPMSDRSLSAVSSRRSTMRSSANMCQNVRHGVHGDMRDTSAASRGKTGVCHTRWVMLAVRCPRHCSPSWRLIRVLRPTALRGASCVLTGRLRRERIRRDVGAGLRTLKRLGFWNVAPCQYRFQAGDIRLQVLPNFQLDPGLDQESQQALRSFLEGIKMLGRQGQGGLGGQLSTKGLDACMNAHHNVSPWGGSQATGGAVVADLFFLM